MATLIDLNTLIISCVSEFVLLFDNFFLFFLIVFLVFMGIRMWRILVDEKADSTCEENESIISDAVPSRDLDLDPWDRDWLE